MTDSTLADAAFGSRPQIWPLPAASTSTGLWLRAVAAGGQGRYATARADLAAVLRGQPGDALASRALSTRASFLRQLGWHDFARGPDGAALGRAGADAEARVDALAGLAADALGVGRLAVAATLLARATAAHRDAGVALPRLGIRLAWVAAELAMAAGDGAAAVRHARDGVELAGQAASQLCRHRVKSNVVLAAALCSSGDSAGARTVADTALADAGAHGLVPLRWAVACLLSEMGSADHSPAEVAEIREASARFITRHGGRLRNS